MFKLLFYIQGVECGSDHKLLAATFKIKLSKPVLKTNINRISAAESLSFQEAVRNREPPQLEGSSNLGKC